MRSQFKILMISAALVTAGLGAAAPAAAATAPPTMDTSTFACNNGVCEVGPGNVGMPFAAGLNVKIPGNYTTAVERYYGDDFTMKISSGSLPPGLQLSLPSTEWIVTGTPTQAGTYSFTVEFTPTPNDPFGQSGTGTQQLSITIGTGSSDRLVATSALYQGHQNRLYVDGYDVNISAQYSVYKTSTGQLVIPAQPNNSTWKDGILTLAAYVNDPCGALNSCNITLKDSLGSSVTITLPPAKY
jgi:Putative Ig domain